MLIWYSSVCKPAQVHAQVVGDSFYVDRCLLELKLQTNHKPQPVKLQKKTNHKPQPTEHQQRALTEALSVYIYIYIYIYTFYNLYASVTVL